MTVLINNQQVIDKRYQLINQIGAGGMGRVFRAMDRLTGQIVTLKQLLLPTDDINFASRETNNTTNSLYLSLAQEFKILSSLRHPNIISVLDYGFDENNQPYFTMDLVENAFTIVKAGQDQPLAIQIDLLVQLLQSLIYLHRRQIVHRDLKPDNVLVTNQRVKVLDFGLAANVDRSQTQSPGHMEEYDVVGTLAYLSPEMLQGGKPSEVADLYAFGIIAYEILVGHYLYPKAMNVMDLIDSVMHQLPDLTPISAIEPALISVFDKLLHKNPKERYQSAQDVLHALCTATHIPVPQESIAIRESFLQTAKFVGRHHELSRLSNALDDSIQGNGSSWLIAGESGVGKSRLLDELRTIGLVKGMMVLRAGSSDRGGMPYELWRAIMRRLCLHVELQDLEASVLKSLIPDINMLIDRPVADPAEVNPEAAKDRIISTIEQVLRRYEKPLLLVVEDLQWGRESLDVLNHIIRLTGQMPLVILGNYREEEAPNLPQKLPDAQVMKLGRLDKSHVQKLSEQILGDIGVAPELVDLLVRETEGNALFIIEAIRTLAVESKNLHAIDPTKLPQQLQVGGIQRLLAARLQRISPEQQQFLSSAAFVGRTFDLDVLAALYSDSSPIEKWLTACLEAALLEVQDENWRFAHDKLRENLLSILSPEDTSIMARQVAQAIETVHPQEESWYPKLVELWHIVGDKPQEVHYLTLAGKNALLNGVNQEAVEYYQRILDMKDDLGYSTQDHADYLYGIGKAYDGLGRSKEAIIYMEQALALLGRPVPQRTLPAVGRILQQISEQYLRRRNWKMRAKSHEEIERLKYIVEINENLFRSYFIANTTLPILMCFLDMANLSERANSTYQIARAFSNLAIAMSLIPLRGASKFYIHKSIELMDEAQELRTYPWVYVRAMNFYISSGDLPEVEQLVDKTMKYLNEIGDDFTYGDKLGLNGYRLLFEGKFQESLQEFGILLDVTNRNQYLSHHAIALYGHTMATLNFGSPAEVQSTLPYAQKALETAQKGSDMIGQVGAIGNILAAQWHLGDYGSVIATLEAHVDTVIKSVPALYMMYPGYIFTLNTMLNMWEHADKTGFDQRRWLPTIDKLLKVTRRFAHLFTVGQPAQLRLEGRYWALKQSDKAGPFFEKALAHPLATRLPVELAHTHADYGRMLLAQDVTKAQQHLQQAKKLYLELNMNGFAAQISDT